MSVDVREIFLLPFEDVRHARVTNELRYRNDRVYDYTFRDIMAIPQFIGEWCDSGKIDLSMDAMEDFWSRHADKRPQGKHGELHRTQKIALDACAEIYQACGFCHFAKIAAKYSGLYDRRGIDLRLLVCGNWVSVNINRQVNVYANDVVVKAKRRGSRGCGGADVIQLTAIRSEMDVSHQPWVPNESWFMAQKIAMENMAMEVMCGR